METTLHATPRDRDVVLEQIRIVGLVLRPVFLVAAVVLAITTLMIAAAIVHRNAESWFDGDASAAISFASFFLPFAVWRGEKPFAASFPWTLPVDRRRLALAKVFAGWAWLIAALATFALWWLGLALLAGTTVILFSFALATATYLFGSALAIGSRHPLRWLFGAAGLFLLVGSLAQVHEIDAFLSASGAFGAVEHADAAWRTLPPPAMTFLSLAIGLLALWGAVSRHAERRRPTT